MRPVIFILIVISSIREVAQHGLNEDLQKDLSKISNKKADFVVTNPVRFTDSAGRVIGFRPIVDLGDGYMKKIAKRYGRNLSPIW